MDPKSQAQQLPDAIKRRRYPIAMTAIVVTITVVGTLYGASLKQNVQVKERTQAQLQEGINDRVNRLKSSRNMLMQSRDELKQKIQEIEARSASRHPKLSNSSTSEQLQDR